MEGVCIYNNSYNQATLVMYKEINNVVFIAEYCNKNLAYNYIDCKTLTQYLPTDCIHILTYMPYLNNITDRLETWRKLVINRLNYLNKQNNYDNTLYHPNNHIETFNNKFKK